jgi:hypothetical protein
MYNSVSSIAVGKDEVYSSTGTSVMVYNKEYAELKKMSRTTGLTEAGISTIAWSEENETLILAYNSTNVDLVKNNLIYNIPDIERKYIPGKKEINRIRTNGKYAYLACSFGIVVVDIIKREIFDTWKPGNGYENSEVSDICFGNNSVYAATDKGVYSADITNTGLAFFGNWHLLTSLPYPDGNYTSCLFSGNKLYVNLSDPLAGGDSVYMIDSGSSLFSFIPGVFNSSFDPSENGFTISSKLSARYFNNDGSLNKMISSYGSGTPYITQAVAEDGNIWLADSLSGLVRGENMTEFSTFNLPGPVSNNAYSITSNNGKTIICAGGADVTWNNQGRPLQVSIHEGNNWTSIQSGTIIDPMRTLIDPDNSDHIFISTWGGGLLEYEGNSLVKQYTESNSPLQTIIPGRAYVRICGMAMDKSKNLWITQTEVPGSIKILKPDGTWIVNPVTIGLPAIGDIIITQSGYKWVVLPKGHGLFILDDNGTPDVFSDDRSRKLLVKDTENQVISFVYCIAEDLDGNLWVGTDQGPLIYYDSEKVFDEEILANRAKIPRNDGTGGADYLLKNETITSIVIDGANRKWIGTNSSGAYHLSSDGTFLLKNFNETNSPILSNSIVSLAIDNKTGDVWFGSSKGIQSYRGETTEGSERYSNVFAFPNPVREDFNGSVIITGLLRNSDIRITDISGNLVYETVSDGGQASWNLKTYNDRRVTTGVYLVFCSSSDGKQAFVTKVLVVGK